MSNGIIFLWVILSVIVGYVATQKDRSFGGFFLIFNYFTNYLDGTFKIQRTTKGIWN